jgi:hypothetical protein
MKLTTKLLRKLIKEVMTEGFERPSYASDEYWAKQKELNDKFGTTYQKIDGRMRRVETPAYQELIKKLEELGRQDVIDRLPVLSSISIYMVAEIAHYVETNDMEALDKMVNKAKRHGQAVIRSGPLGT